MKPVINAFIAFTSLLMLSFFLKMEFVYLLSMLGILAIFIDINQRFLGENQRGRILLFIGFVLTMFVFFVMIINSF